MAPAALDAFLASAAEAGRVGLHVECAPGRPFPPEPIAFVAAVPGGASLAAPLAGEGAAAGRALLARLFAHDGVEVVAHESKRLHLAAAALGIAPPRRVVRRDARGLRRGPGPELPRSRGRRPSPPRARPGDDPLAEGRRGERSLRDRRRARDRSGPGLPRPARAPSARPARRPPPAPLGACRLAPRLRGDRAAARAGPGADGARRGSPSTRRRSRPSPSSLSARLAEPREGDPLGRGRGVQRRLSAAARPDPLREAEVPRPSGRRPRRRTTRPAPTSSRS